jgi:large subunit ribosomal protein L5
VSESIIKSLYKEAVPNLMTDLGHKSSMAVPKISKVTLNMGLGAEAINDRKVVDNAVEELRLISGQQPIKTNARKSVASFKLREGYTIGCKVTLRGNMMFEFLDRLLGIAIPRERDFRGLNPKSFDGRGNYTLGIKEHIIFPEIDYDKVQKIRGLDVCITTTATNNEEGLKLLKALKFPFRT